VECCKHTNRSRVEYNLARTYDRISHEIMLLATGHNVVCSIPCLRLCPATRASLKPWCCCGLSNACASAVLTKHL
jgi:hypothetical protein